MLVTQLGGGLIIDGRNQLRQVAGIESIHVATDVLVLSRDTMTVKRKRAIAVAPPFSMLLGTITTAPGPVPSTINILVLIAINGGIPSRGFEWGKVTQAFRGHFRERDSVPRDVNRPDLTGILLSQEKLDLDDERLSSLVGGDSSIRAALDPGRQSVGVIIHRPGVAIVEAVAFAQEVTPPITVMNVQLGLLNLVCIDSIEKCRVRSLPLVPDRDILRLL